MLSVLPTAPPHDSPRVKFATALGFASARKEPVTAAAGPSRPTDDGAYLSFTRRSVDIVTGYSAKRRQRRERSSVTDSSLFDPDPQAHTATPATSSAMPGKNISSPVISVRRLHRVEEGPWTISVAETPHDPSSYSLYIKSECGSCLSTLHEVCVVMSQLAECHHLQLATTDGVSSCAAHLRRYDRHARCQRMCRHHVLRSQCGLLGPASDEPWPSERARLLLSFLITSKQSSLDTALTLSRSSDP